MPIEIFKLPRPSSWFDSPKFFERLRRSCELLWEYEKVEGAGTAKLSLIFHVCWGVKITYFSANDTSVYKIAYDKLVDFGDTEWLLQIKANITAARVEFQHLRHLGIFFDDGPFYEFVCEAFEIVDNVNESETKSRLDGI